MLPQDVCLSVCPSVLCLSVRLFLHCQNSVTKKFVFCLMNGIRNRTCAPCVCVCEREGETCAPAHGLAYNWHNSAYSDLELLVGTLKKLDLLRVFFSRRPDAVLRPFSPPARTSASVHSVVAPNFLSHSISCTCTGKCKGKWIYIASYSEHLTLKVHRCTSHSFTCKLHHTCLHLVSLHHTLPPLTSSS